MTNAEMHLKAGQGITTLTQRMKFLCQEHRERINRLRRLSHDIETNDRKHPGQGDLVAAPLSVPPEVLDLVEDPLDGL